MVKRECLILRDMKTFEIWRTGYAITGGNGEASKLGEEEAETFNEAVQKHSNKYPGKDLRKTSDGRWVDWGCTLYDNETEARQSFG